MASNVIPEDKTKSDIINKIITTTCNFLFVIFDKEMWLHYAVEYIKKLWLVVFKAFYILFYVFKSLSSSKIREENISCEKWMCLTFFSTQSWICSRTFLAAIFGGNFWREFFATLLCRKKYCKFVKYACFSVVQLHLGKCY